MTKKQAAIWRQKMTVLERRMIAYYATRSTNPTTVDPPDGSFCMNAFNAGYYLAKRMKAKEAGRG